MDITEIQKLAARTVFRRRQVMFFITAMHSAQQAKTKRDWSGMAKALTMASKVADTLGRSAGVLRAPGDAPKNRISDDLMAEVTRLIKRTEEMRRGESKCDSLPSKPKS